MTQFFTQLTDIQGVLRLGGRLFQDSVCEVELPLCHIRCERHNSVIRVLEQEAFAQPVKGLELLPTSFQGSPGLPEVGNETIFMEIIGLLRACKFQVSCSYGEFVRRFPSRHGPLSFTVLIQFCTLFSNYAGVVWKSMQVLRRG